MPNGVLVHYWLKEKPGKDEVVKIEILSGDKVIRSFSSEKKEPEGDLKEQAEKKELEKDKDKPLEPKAGVEPLPLGHAGLQADARAEGRLQRGDEGAAEGRAGDVPGPAVGRGPGLSRRRWRSGRTRRDRRRPRTSRRSSTCSPSIRDRLSETHETVLKIRDAREQSKELGERAQRLGKGDALKKQRRALGEKLTAVELELTNPEIKADEDDLNYEPKLDHDFVNLAGIVASADRKPTAGSVKMYAELKARLDAIVKEYQALLEKDVADFNRAAEEAKLPRVAPAPKIEK